MSFPENKISTASGYWGVYIDQITRGASTICAKQLDTAARMLLKAILSRANIFVCGNGGSAAISNHLVCDFNKGIRTGTSLHPRVFSLADNISILTAVGNDLSYDDVFVYQLAGLAQSDDLLITISSSGNSENIIRAINWAKENQLTTIALTGFSGGRSAELADVNLHIDSSNYGVVEDLHQSIMHVLAQYLRHGEIPVEQLRNTAF